MSFLFPERLHCCYIYFHCFFLYNYYQREIKDLIARCDNSSNLSYFCSYSWGLFCSASSTRQKEFLLFLLLLLVALLRRLLNAAKGASSVSAPTPRAFLRRLLKVAKGASPVSTPIPGGSSVAPPQRGKMSFSCFYFCSSRLFCNTSSTWQKELLLFLLLFLVAFLQRLLNVAKKASPVLALLLVALLRCLLRQLQQLLLFLLCSLWLFYGASSTCKRRQLATSIHYGWRDGRKG